MLLYLWLDSPDHAIKRVAKRVAKGGHHIPDDVVKRRYYRGIRNLIQLYTPLCDRWLVFDHNAIIPPETPFADKVLYGLRKALRKLVVESAANGECLVIKRDGEIKEVPAKELLKNLPKEEFS